MFKIKPLQDRIIVERIIEGDTTPGGIFIPEAAKEKASEGNVVAVGEGKELKDGTLRALSLSVGDRVMFEKYGGTEIKVDGKEYVMLREEQILGVVLPDLQANDRAPGWDVP
jgi:chaperonin GroES